MVVQAVVAGALYPHWYLWRIPLPNSISTECTLGGTFYDRQCMTSHRTQPCWSQMHLMQCSTAVITVMLFTVAVLFAIGVAMPFTTAVVLWNWALGVMTSMALEMKVLQPHLRCMSQVQNHDFIHVCMSLL